MTREEATTLLRKIKAECDRHRKCHRCPFYHTGCICDGIPIDWDISEEGDEK